MTEHEWLLATDPSPMLEFLQGEASDRKLLLFALNAVEETRELCDERLLDLLAVTEKFVDGTLSASEIEAHWGRNAWPLRPFAWARALGFRNTEKKLEFKRNQAPILVGLVRELFGNPFRLVTLNPSWLTSTVLALATGIYDEKAFERMPILADALQDVGCENEDILNHLRGPGPHTKGCWALDLLLGKD